MLSLYRKANWTIVVSIAIFLILDISILFTNIWLSHQIERDAIGINLAGRQRMLSQQMSKTVLLLNRWPADTDERSALQQELVTAYHLFDDTLTAFQQGGKVVDTRGKSMWIAPLQAARSDRTLSDALAIWGPWRPRFHRIDQPDLPLTPALIAELEPFAQNDNRQLLVLMNELTTLWSRRRTRTPSAYACFRPLPCCWRCSILS